MAYEMAHNPAGVIERALDILNDYGANYHKRNKLWTWLLDGQREVALQVPESTTVSGNLALVAGVSQSIPATSHCLFDIPRNTAGQAIRPIPRSILDEMRPGWAAETGSTVIKHYIYDPEKSKTTFEVWPPAAAGASVFCVSSAMPDDSSKETNEFAIDKRHVNALVDYTVFRALNKITGNPTFAEHAAKHLQLFLMGCGKSEAAGLLLHQRKAMGV